MIKYIETKNIAGKNVLIKVDAIREVEDRGDNCRINDCVTVNISYEDLKRILNADERRVMYSDEMDYRLKHLISNNIWYLFKEYGNSKAIEYMKEVLTSEDESDMYAGIKSVL